MEYITREGVPASFGTRLGMNGVTHVYEQGQHIEDTIFTLFVDDGAGGNPDAWCVGCITRARALTGELSAGGTVIVFGDTNRQPFTSFEAALAFCSAVGRDMYDRRITNAYMDGLIQRRAMQAAQWIDAPEGSAGPAGDEGDDSEGGTCDVSVEVPAGRVLH